jgi:hypothetical protein
MRNEKLFLIAFIVLAITLLVMVTHSSRENFEDPIANLKEEVDELNKRTITIENNIQKQEDDRKDAENKLDNNITDIQMVT